MRLYETVFGGPTPGTPHRFFLRDGLCLWFGVIAHPEEDQAEQAYKVAQETYDKVRRRFSPFLLSVSSFCLGLFRVPIRQGPTSRLPDLSRFRLVSYKSPEKTLMHVYRQIQGEITNESRAYALLQQADRTMVGAARSLAQAGTSYSPPKESPKNAYGFRNAFPLRAFALHLIRVFGRRGRVDVGYVWRGRDDGYDGAVRSGRRAAAGGYGADAGHAGVRHPFPSHSKYEADR